MSTTHASEYKLLVSSKIQDLNSQVQKYLDDGWSLYGQPIIVSKYDGTMHFSQAVINE